MSTIKTILVPIDFSDTSEIAAGRALEVAARVKAQIVFLHVIDDLPAMLHDGPGALPAATRDAYERRLKTELEAAAMRAFVAQIPSRCLVEHGSPARTIVDVAEREAADLIVMGTDGRKGMRRLMLGSAAEEVVRTAPVPVLTVHTESACARTPPRGVRLTRNA